MLKNQDKAEPLASCWLLILFAHHFYIIVCTLNDDKVQWVGVCETQMEEKSVSNNIFMPFFFANMRLDVSFSLYLFSSCFFSTFFSCLFDPLTREGESLSELERNGCKARKRIQEEGRGRERDVIKLCDLFAEKPLIAARWKPVFIFYLTHTRFKRIIIHATATYFWIVLIAFLSSHTNVQRKKVQCRHRITYFMAKNVIIIISIADSCQEKYSLSHFSTTFIDVH